MVVRVRELVEAAEQEVTTLTVAELAARRERDDVVVVDVRDRRELEREGRVPGAFHCPRGMLEFWIDPESPYHHDVFAAPEGTEFVFYCAAGWRSALAAQTAGRMGLRVAHLGGGFGAWRDADGAVEDVARR